MTALGDINEADWHALVIINTTEAWRLQSEVKAFLDRSQHLGKIVLLSTSGDGTWKTKDYGIDALSSASRTGELSSLCSTIVARVEQILARPGE